jgi:hypothetical protein
LKSRTGDERNDALRFRMQATWSARHHEPLMETMFKALHELIKELLRPNGGVKTDNSILLIIRRRS